jgi:hypothetical protein
MFERVTRAALIVAVSGLLNACTPAAIASLLPVAAGPLATVTTRGGECVNGPCGSTIVIERNGQVRQTAPTEAALGIVPANALVALDAAVKAADFDAIKSRKFTGECPTAFDG